MTELKTAIEKLEKVGGERAKAENEQLHAKIEQLQREKDEMTLHATRCRTR
jgi:hypothetical protein